MRIHHIGYLVRKLDRAAARFKQLGFSVVQEAVYDEYRKIDILFMGKDGYIIELIAATSQEAVVSGLYKKFRNAPYHLCYGTSSFDEELKQLCENGYVQIDQPHPAPAFFGRRVVFLLCSDIGMIELVEE